MHGRAPHTSSRFPPAPPEAWEPLQHVARLARRPLERFLRIEAASGILLLVMAALALLWANSPWGAQYTQLWQTTLGIKLGAFTFERTLEWFVNDVLMVIFFFVVGLEIRRELHHGELSEWRRAALPVVAALGGMVAPAALYLVFAGGRETQSGWGVPMATDIAFAVGILTLLGRRVPAALRVLLLALAVIDDLGAIIVIALFYSAGISAWGLAVAALGVGGVLLLQRLGVRAKLAYVVPGTVTWAGIYAAGVHPTIAGVLIGLLTPMRSWLGTHGFVDSVREDLDHLEQLTPPQRSPHELEQTLRHVDSARREVLSPTESLIETLHPWVAFAIMPVFALANAGVTLAGASLDAAGTRVLSAVAIGLLLGKPLGILLASWLALRAGIAALPLGMSLRHLLVLGVVAGVGFTMALFIAQLAFDDAQLLAAAKLGVLSASAAAAVLALALGRMLLSTIGVQGAALTADEAESGTAI